VLDILLQNRRDKAAARRFLRRLLKQTGTVQRVVVTDKLRSYRAAHREVMPSVAHRSHKGLNNRAENSHQPTRQRERAMKGFRSVGGAQRIPAAFSGISPHVRPGRHNRPPPRNDHPLHNPGPDHRRRQGARHGLTQSRQPARACPDTPPDTHTPDNVTVPGRLPPPLWPSEPRLPFRRFDL